MVEVVPMSRPPRPAASPRLPLAAAQGGEARERLRRCARAVAAFLRRSWDRPLRVQEVELVEAVARFCRTGRPHARLLLHRLEPAWCAEWNEGWIDLAIEPWAALVERRLPACLRPKLGPGWLGGGGLALPACVEQGEADAAGALRALAAAPELRRHWPVVGLSAAAGAARDDLREVGLLDGEGRLAPQRLAALVRSEDLGAGLKRSDWRALWDWEARCGAALLGGPRLRLVR